MRTIIAFAACLLLLSACGGSKNLTVRDNVKKKIGDNQTIGVDEYKKGNYNAARLFLESALKDAYSIDNTDGVIDAMRNLAEVHMRMGNLAETSNYIFRAKDLSDKENRQDDPLMLLTLGKYYDRMENYDLAIQTYLAAMKASKSEPVKAMVYNSTGISKMKQKNFDEAVEQFNKAVVINNSSQNFDALGDNYFNLGEVYDRKGDNNSALTNYLLALKNDKTSEKSDAILEDLKRIGQNYGRLNDSVRAVNYLNRALTAAESKGYKNEVEEIQKLLNSYK